MRGFGLALGSSVFAGAGDLFSLWSRWLHGEKVEDYQILWGLKVLWWARIGKGMELVAALSILVDILGPQRLRAFGLSLHEHFGTTKTWHSVLNVLKLKGFERDVGRSPLFRLLFRLGLWLSPICILLTVLLSVYGHQESIVTAVIFGVIFGVGVAVTTFAVLFWLLAMFLGLTLWLALLVTVLHFILINPLANLLELEWFDRLVKALSLLILLAGFQFDLLGS